MTQRYAGDTPVAANARERIFREYGLVCAVKRAKSEMHNANLKGADIVLRPRYVRRKPLERGKTETGHKRYADLGR